MSYKVLIIGGVAAGAKTASRIKRRDPEADVTIIEKGEFLSYAACGLPFFIEGMFEDYRELTKTPVGVIRDINFFKNVKGVNVLTKTKAEKIDRTNKTVLAINTETGAQQELKYDKLVLATGSYPFVPPIEGVNLNNIFKLSTIEDGLAIKGRITDNGIKKVVIVGAGLIGIEMIEAFKKHDIDVSVVEMQEWVLPALLDPEMGYLVGAFLKSKGINLLTSETVVKFEGDSSGNVKKVITNNNELDADMVLMSIGVRPSTDLAKGADLKIGTTGAIEVNEYMQTSDPDIYAGGDCVENVHLLTGAKIFTPMGSTANKHGRVIADHITGLKTPFPGVLGTGISEVLGYKIGRTGLSETDAINQGYEVETVITPAPDKPHFYPGSAPIIIKLVADKKTSKVIGTQILGMGDVAKRVDVVVTAMSFGATVENIFNLDLAYAPPFSPALDNIITAAHVMDNKLKGLARGISPLSVKKKLDNNEDFLFLDVRTPQEYKEMRIPYPNVKLIPLGKLRGELDSLPKEKEIITFCKISLRGYEAQRILDANGFKNVRFMDGGVLAWPFEKELG